MRTAAELPAPPAAAGLAPLRRALLAHWDRSHRDLPWRRSRDPWAILVSEVMLQQTTVAAAAPYWERFLRRWPRPADFARAERSEVLAEWAGLGYYRRAEHLQRTASVVAERGGELPRTHAALLELPGIGPYTAAAVASIAHGEPVPAIDGNAERVLTRLFGLPGDPKRGATAKALRAHAAALLDRRRAGDFNQALMELGATVCRPVAPACLLCPLRRHCAALAAGEPERYPELPPRAKSVPVLAAAALLVRDGRVLLLRREAAPNAGFLELPGVEAPREAPWIGAGSGGGAREQRHLRALLVRALEERHGLTVRAGEPLAPLRHAITRYRIRVQPFRAELLAGRPRAPLAWCVPGAPDTPLTTVTRRALAAADPELLRPPAARPPAA